MKKILYTKDTIDVPEGTIIDIDVITKYSKILALLFNIWIYTHTF